MKYVVSWVPLPTNSEDVQARSLQVFGQWSPAEGTNFVQFLGRVDGRGGFAVVETDDVTLLARDMAVFGAFLEMSVYPVLDIEESARLGLEAIEFRRSVG